MTIEACRLLKENKPLFGQVHSCKDCPYAESCKSQRYGSFKSGSRHGERGL